MLSERQNSSLSPCWNTRAVNPHAMTKPKANKILTIRLFALFSLTIFTVSSSKSRLKANAQMNGERTSNKTARTITPE